MLIGGQEIMDTVDENAVLHFYGGLFDRLTKETMHTGGLTRYIGFQCPLGGTERLYFFGIAVNRIERIPPGMVAWDIDNNTLRVWAPAADGDELASTADISWRWRQWLSGGYGGLVGGFTLEGPASLGSLHVPDEREFQLSAHACVMPGAPDDGVDDVMLVEYDPSWPDRFEKMAVHLRKNLGPDIALSIEHYGSTSIPGMPAKPVIDILVEVPSYDEAVRRAFECLVGEEWEYWLYADHVIFVKREKLMGIRMHHVHMAPRGHRLWEGLAFRDYLRVNPADADRYAALKRELAERYRDDRERYTTAKTAFVQEITDRSLRNL